MRVIMCAEKTREQASDKRIYSHLSSIEYAPFSLSMMYICVYIYTSREIVFGRTKALEKWAFRDIIESTVSTRIFLSTMNVT